jgi:hypothetical protein
MVRAGTAQGIGITISRRGDEDAGAILLKQNLMGAGFRVLTQIRTGDGSPAWMPGTGPGAVEESAADSFIAREIERDYDVWVIEIDDREGRLPLGGSIIL